jgi:hypothetical protein
MSQRADIAPPRVMIVLLLAFTISHILAAAMLQAENAVPIQAPSTQTGQALRKGQILEGSHVVKPSPREREAIYQLLAAKPRPKTLKDADMKYLKGLLDKQRWFGFDQKMVHEIWSEVTGKEWRDTEGPVHPKNEGFR